MSETSLSERFMVIGADFPTLVRTAAAATDAPGSRWLIDHAPRADAALPSSHEEVGDGETFAFRRPPMDSDPEVLFRDWLD